MVLLNFLDISDLTSHIHDKALVVNMGSSDISKDTRINDTRRRHMEETCGEQHNDSDVYLEYLITDDRHHVLYCFIPKVGCTSFLSMMVKNIGIRNNRQWFYPRYLNIIGLKQLSLYSSREITTRLHNYFSFMVVRHPFDRLVSAYQQKFGGLKQSHNFSPRYKQVIKNHFGHIQKVDSRGNVLLSWPQFLELVVTEPKRFYDHHWATYEHLCNPCAANYSHVVYMETMADDLDLVLDHLTGPNRSKPMLEGRNVIRNTTNNMSHLYDKFADIDPDIIQGLLHMYDHDLELFGYTWNATGAGCIHC